MLQILPQLLAAKITNLLMQKPGLTAEELRAQVGRSSKPPTPQAVYKELRRLQALSTVVKSKSRYYLGLPALFSARTAIEQAIEAHTDERVLESFLPGPGEARTWRFSDILAMDRLVVNLLVTLLRTSEKKTVYHWDPYPWYAVFHPELAEPFLAEFSRAGFQAYGIIGVKSAISDSVRDSQGRYGHRWWIGKPPFPARKDTFLSICAPFLLTIKHPPESVAVFEKLFRSVSPTSESLAAFHRLHFQKLTFTVRLANAERKAERLEAEYLRLFHP